MTLQKSFWSVGAALALVGWWAALAGGAEPLETKGKLDEVIVYRGQALVTRLVEIPGPAGLREVVVTGLPERVVAGSLFAESADGVEVRSVRYRVRPVIEDVREEVRKLDEQIRAVSDQAEAINRKMRVLGEQKAYLEKLEQFTAPTATVELTKGVLNAETLKALTTFQFEQRRALADEELKLGIELRGLNEKLNLLGRERDVLTSGSARAIREAVVFTNLTGNGGRIRVRYLVDGATWSPSYNARADANRGDVLIEYNAAIEQMSGEDWTDVTMSLSTATPSLVARAPLLEPLVISLAATEPPAGKPSFDYFSAKKELEQRQRDVEKTRGASAPGIQQAANQQGGQYAAREDLDAALNRLAGEGQVLDLVSTGRLDKSAKNVSQPADEAVSVTYKLPARTSLPSRADRQLIQIASLPMKGDFYRVGIPMLTSYVYEEASVTNDGKMVLLAGPVETYLAGQFVGHGEIPTVAVGESFTVGFGIDTSLRVGRELVKKNESIQGGNRVVDFTYQLVVENFGSEPAEVRLFDRMPTAKENDVKLTLVSPGKELSADPRYQQAERKKGLLRWDVTVPPQSIGPKALTIDYEMRLEYDKQLSIAGLPGRE